MPARYSPAAVDIATRLIALDLGLHPSHVLIDMGNGSTVIAQVIVQHRSWRDDHGGGMILACTRALLMAIQDDHTDLALRRRALKRAIARALEDNDEPRVTTGRADHVHYELPQSAEVADELGAVVVKCAYPAPHHCHRHMGRNRTVVWCPGIPRAVTPIPPTEEWMWRNDPITVTRPSPWKQEQAHVIELGADVADSSDPEEFDAPLATPAWSSRQTCTACHGTGEMHDPPLGVMACDRCSGEPLRGPTEGVTHEQPGLELGAEVGSPEKNADAPTDEEQDR